MIHTLSVKLVSKLLSKSSDVYAEDAEIYIYGAECLINEVITDILLLLIGILTSHVLFIIIWDITFTLLRIHIGGLHAASHGACIFTSLLLGMAAIFSAPYLSKVALYNLLLLLVLLVPVAKNAPLSHANHPISSEEWEKKHRVALAIYIIEGVLGIICFWLQLWVISALLAGMDAAVFLYLIKQVQDIAKT